MNTNNNNKIVYPLLLSLTMVVGMWIGYQLRNNSAEAQFFSGASKSAVSEALQLISKRYVDRVNEDSLSQIAIDALLSHLDPHSVYIPPASLTDANEDLMGVFEGVGIEFDLMNDTLHVIHVIEGGPSYEAGILAGDKILFVNDTLKVSGVNAKIDEVIKKLRGVGGSTITLSVLKNDIVKKIKVVRRSIPIPSVTAAFKFENKIGYIKIEKFAERTYEEFMQSLEKIHKEGNGIDKLILDLRGNGGGILKEAVSIADEFLSEDKLIVYTQGIKNDKVEYRCRKDGLFESGQLIVLVDEGSASASEVLAGALQDWDRAIILGRRTFGKGLVQQQFGLSNGGAIRLTTARYYTPLGRNIQKPYAANAKVDDVHGGYFSSNHTSPLNTDSMYAKGKVFVTPKGNKLYGGGGITPDTIMDVDSSNYNELIQLLDQKQVYLKSAYTFLLMHKEEINKLKNAKDLLLFIVKANIWEELKKNILNAGVSLDKVSAQNKHTIIVRTMSLIAYQAFGKEAYYQVENSNDKLIQKALSMLK